MKKFLISGLVFLSTVCHATNATFNAPGPSFLVNFNSEAQLWNGICVGGDICGKNDALTVQYPAGSWVNGVSVGAHDKVGGQTKAHLQIYINGNYAGEQDVKSDGSTLAFPVHTFVNTIKFMSVNQDHKPGGDETQILQLQSY